MFNISFDSEQFRQIIREELELDRKRHKHSIKELPPMLTRGELKSFLRIGDTKASELLARADFPVLREAGVLIPTHLLMKWIENNTEWIDLNSSRSKRK